jgi:Kef-type K+ transport system membrane component KefB
VTAHDTGLLLADLALVIALARLFGAAARRIGQPPVIGEIVAGILLGPTLFGGALTEALFPQSLRPALAGLAQVGLVLFMFIVGYELDRSLVRGRGRVAAAISIGSTALPLVAGAALGLVLAGRHGVAEPLPFALFIGAAMAVTAFPVLARILTDRGMHRTRTGGLALAGAAVDDVLAWSLLAVVITLAGDGAGQWRVLLAVPYVVVMFTVVRPLLRRLLGPFRAAGRITPGTLSVVLVGLLLSCWATELIGVHLIFGAFLFGIVMPRPDRAGDSTAAQLRQQVLDRLEHLGTLLLLPVFFVIAGLQIDLTLIDIGGLGELAAILAVAVGGKFAGAFWGARLGGVDSRRAGAIAALMNTRGLTEIVILTVGLELGVLDHRLYSLMVVMALVTTVMTGPLLRVLHPPERVRQEVAETEAAAVVEPSAHRVLVALGVGTPAPLVGVGLALVGPHRPAELVLSHLLPYDDGARLEVGTGLGGELLAVTAAMRELQRLAAPAVAREVAAPALVRFTDDRARDLAQQIAATRPAVVLLAADDPAAAMVGELDDVRVVLVHDLPAAPPAVAVRWPVGTADAGAAVEVGAAVAADRGLPLVLDGAGRRVRAAAAELAHRGVPVRVGAPPATALVVAPAEPPGTDAHLRVRPERIQLPELAPPRPAHVGT